MAIPARRHDGRQTFNERPGQMKGMLPFRGPVVEFDAPTITGDDLARAFKRYSRTDEDFSGYVDGDELDGTFDFDAVLEHAYQIAENRDEEEYD